MRGLPPTPDGVVLVQQTWQAQQGQCTTDHWLLAPGAEVASVADIRRLLGDWFFFVTAAFLDATPTDTSCSALRCSTYGSAATTVVDIPAFNVGAVPGDSAPLNAASCMTWLTQTRGPSHAHTRLPLALEWVAPDRVHLNELGYAGLGAAANRALEQCANVRSPADTPCLLGTVTRQRAGAPLPSASFVPFFGARADPFVATLDRRVRAVRRSSPTT